jgi:hypothetical protein
MPAFIDLTGHTYGDLTVVTLAWRGGAHGRTKWLCRCVCGRERGASAKNLRNGSLTSCGCRRAKPRLLRRPPLVLDDVVMIRLTRGLVATIDKVDAELARFNWTTQSGHEGQFYASRHIPGTGRVLLHRVVASLAGFAIDGLEVDHKDGDTMNCRRANLRPANRFQNAQNMGLKRSNSSGAKGVSWHSQTGKWAAGIRANGKRRYLGLFASKEEAADAYRRAAAELHGEFCRVG